MPLGRKKTKKDAEVPKDDVLAKHRSNHVMKKLEERRKDNKAKVDPHVEEQFLTGRLYGKECFPHPLGEFQSLYC